MIRVYSRSIHIINGHVFHYNSKVMESQMQTIDQTQYEKLDQENALIFSNHAFGMLFAHIERLFLVCGIDVGQKYEKYLVDPNVKALDVMRNIENSMIDIHFYSYMCKSQGKPAPKFPEDPETFDKWVKHVHDIQRTSDFNCLADDIIHFVNGRIDKKKMIVLHESLVDRINKEMERYRNNDYDDHGNIDSNIVVSKTQQVNSIEADTKYQIEEAKREGKDITVLSPEPILKY